MLTMIVPTVEELRATFLFSGCTDEQLEWLVAHSEVVEFPPATSILSEEQEPDAFWVLLKGKVQFTRKFGERELVTETSEQPGVWGGWLPLWDDLLEHPLYTIRALSACRELRLDKDVVRELLKRGFPVVNHLIAGISGGAKNFEAMTRQQEKMAALGKLSAGLAHELNNPAAAVRRSVEQMRELWQPQEENALKLGQQLDQASLAALMRFRNEAIARMAMLPLLDPMHRSDLEDELQDWLDEHGIEDAWQLAPVFIDVGLRVEHLEGLLLQLPEEVYSLALRWLSSSLTVLALTKTLEGSAKRISELVKAIKSYTYMDQGSLQEVDMHEALEDTLRILGYKLKKQSVTVERLYDAHVPKILAYGSLLNQAWTNLLDNAIDALQTIPAYARHITIRTLLDGDYVQVEIQDNGPGVAKEIQSRIFEPFFTTKPQGKGTGLGLETTYRIVQQHHGDITVKSRSGETRFVVRLPLTQ
jgi:signal transduction histidine kinase